LSTFRIIDEKTPCYSLDDFHPGIVSRELLADAGIGYDISDRIADELNAGSVRFEELYRSRSLAPELKWSETTADVDAELEIHNYTGICPTDVLEVTPSAGSCSLACQYCLVTDGNHTRAIEVITNYAEKLANSLDRNWNRPLFYYFSPKTEAFSEPHLYTGLAHEILRTFLRHYDKHPDSAIRVFIATKAGPKHLEFVNRGDSVFQLLARLASKVQVNGSIGIMPEYLRDALEPRAAGVEERLEALQRCQSMGIWAESVLCQPLLLPYLTPEAIEEFMETIGRAGIKNIKPEFLTTNLSNLVLISQYIRHFDPAKLVEFFHPYLREENQGHLKQRSRLAPDRDACVEKLALIRSIAERHGMTVSICNWVKRELGKAAAWDPSVDQKSREHGYRCLGYQMGLFPVLRESEG
jgi:DNA repair photolyase